MDNYSKQILKTDESSKEMQIKCLKGDQGHGFDIDTIYNVNGVWYVFEYLKCNSDWVSPYSSEPARYPWNWRKFHSLYSIATQLKGKLVLVNYSDRERDEDQVKVMIIQSIDYEMLKSYIKYPYSTKKLDYIKFEYVKDMTFEEYSDWLREINKNSEIVPF